MEDDVPEVRDVFLDRVDDGLREGFAAVWPSAVAQRVRCVLDEARHDVLPRRSEGRIHRRRDAHVDERPVGEVPVLRVVVRLLDVIDARPDRDRALQLRPAPRERGEARRLREGEVRFARGALDLEVLDTADEVGGEVGSFQKFQERPLRVGSGRDDLRLDPFATSELDAHGPSILHEDLPDLRVHPDLGSVGTGGARDRFTDHSHAAADVPPGTVGAVDLSHVVMHEHVRGAGRAGAQERPDDPARAEPRLQGVRLEPLVQVVRRAHRHQPCERVQLVLAQRLHLLVQGEELPEFRRVQGPDVGRRHRQRRRDELREARHEPAESRVGLRIAAGEFRDCLECVLLVSVTVEVPPVRQGREARLLWDDLESVGRKFEIPDHLRSEEAADVGADRELEPGEHLLGHSGPSENATTLQDQDPFPRSGEVGRGGEAVVPPADHDCVVARGQRDTSCGLSVPGRRKTAGADRIGRGVKSLPGEDQRQRSRPATELSNSNSSSRSTSSVVASSPRFHWASRRSSRCKSGAGAAATRVLTASMNPRSR